MKKTRIHRLIRIVQLLQAGRRCGVDALATDLDVSRRTVFRDISVLKEAGVDCQYDADNETYALTSLCYLRPVDMTIEEGMALMLLTRKFANEQVIPGFSSAISAALKIESMLPAEIRQFCGAMLDGVSVDWRQMSDVDPITDLIGTVQSAIADRTKLVLRYDSYFERREIATVIRPYWMPFLARGWYLIGYSEHHRETRTFKIERIVELTLLPQHFKPDPNFNIKDYFGNAWNMIRGKERHHVEIHFSRKVAGNVEEVAWHSTQRTRRRSDDSLIFEADVDGIDEIAWWVLGYGDQAIVREPEILRQTIATHAKTTLRYYERDISAPIPRD